MAETIPLRDALLALRSELKTAAKDASSESVRFELGPVELEFQVVAKTEIGAEGKLGGKINFHIFSAEASVGGSGKGSDERTQRVKFVLNPIFVSEKGERKAMDIGRRRHKSK